MKQSERTCSILGPELIEVLASVDVTSIIRVPCGPPASLLLLRSVGSRWHYRHRLFRVMRSGRRYLSPAILIWWMVGGARGNQLHRASVGTRGSWFLMPIIHTLLHISTSIWARCLWSVGASTRLLLALAAKQQIRLATGLRDVAVASSVVMLVLIALKQMLTQATDRLCVAKDSRVIRLLLIVDIVPIRDRIDSSQRIIASHSMLCTLVAYGRN